MGVTTGITLEFQFGTNWAYYSHYVGDVFGVPLAIEGMMAFFLESTFVGLFFFGWERLGRLCREAEHSGGERRCGGFDQLPERYDFLHETPPESCTVVERRSTDISRE